MKVPCEDCGGKYCMCDACQSMKETIQELTGLKGEDIMEKDKAKKIFEKMKKALID